MMNPLVPSKWEIYQSYVLLPAMGICLGCNIHTQTMRQSSLHGIVGEREVVSGQAPNREVRRRIEGVQSWYTRSDTSKYSTYRNLVVVWIFLTPEFASRPILLSNLYPWEKDLINGWSWQTFCTDGREDFRGRMRETTGGWSPLDQLQSSPWASQSSLTVCYPGLGFSQFTVFRGPSWQIVE
jgi:hypothetical protein